MRQQLYVDDVRVGDRVPALDVTVDPTQMFFFSAATYNGHRIHYDRSWATEVEGYPELLVQGPLQSALLARSITDWIGGRGRLLRLSFQNRAVAYPGDPMRFEGTVIAVDVESGTVELSVLATKGGSGEVLMPGTATVRLPRRA